MKRIGLYFLIVLISSLNAFSQNQHDNFSFVFLTDIHLQYEENAVEGFQKAIERVNQINPDFAITGGDLIMDALGQTYGRSDSLYQLYNNTIKKINIPVYHTIGNHEVYGWYSKSNADRMHPEFGEKMFEKRIGPRYQSFNHKGWHFIILDSVEEHEKGNAYVGLVDSVQMDWIKADLAEIDKNTPIVLATHIPVITAQIQLEAGPQPSSVEGWVLNNPKEVLALFSDHNLKLILQGHLHIFEHLYIYDMHFVTGGAVSGSWWGGPYKGTEEGFVLITTIGADFALEYIDYEWSAGLDQNKK